MNVKKEIDYLMKRLVIISLDALSSDDFKIFSENDRVKQYIKQAHVVEQADSVFVSNTYVVHSSVVTGLEPFEHGVISNVKYKPLDNNPDWHWYLSDIKKPTLFSIAKQNGLKTLSIMWPATARGNIDYNIPEVFTNRWWKSQVLFSLWSGKFFYTIKMFAKFRHLLDGIKQPNRDDFCNAAFCDTIVAKKPHFMTIHFTDTDTQKHEFGIKSPEVMQSIDRMAARVEKIVDALKTAEIFDETSVIIMSDHAQVDIEQTIDINKFLEKNNLLSNKLYFEPAGGCAFLFCNNSDIDEVKQLIETNAETLGFDRYLSEEELKVSGYLDKAAFGISAKYGFEYTDNIPHKGNHGYTLDRENYKPFYCYFGKDVKPHVEQSGKLTDIFGLSLRLLGINR